MSEQLPRTVKSAPGVTTEHIGHIRGRSNTGSRDAPPEKHFRYDKDRPLVPSAYDVVVIGAGTGGYVAAIRTSQLGKKVAVVEKQRPLGGTCLIWGCIPTKALLEHAHAFQMIQHASDWGVALPYGAPALDMRLVHARKDKIVAGLSKGIEFFFKKYKIDRIRGTARLVGKGRVEVFEGEKQTLEAKEIIVATGSARHRDRSCADCDQ